MATRLDMILPWVYSVFVIQPAKICDVSAGGIICSLFQREIGLHFSVFSRAKDKVLLGFSCITPFVVGTL